MLSDKNRAILLMAQTKPFEVKPKSQPKKTFGTPVPKDDGKAEWVRFKTECVLLKGGRSR